MASGGHREGWETCSIPNTAPTCSQDYVEAGFDTFDMADHYGSAELIAGRLMARSDAGRRPVAFTKWCPEPGPMTADIVRQGRPAAARPARRREGRPPAAPLVDVRASGLAGRAASDGRPEGGRADRRARRHQFRRGASARRACRRRSARHQPGVVLAASTAVPQANFRRLPQRDGREAPGLRHALRRLSVRQMAWQGGAGGIADWSRGKYKRFIDVAGGWAAFPGYASRGTENRRPAWRLDLQRRDPLGARARGRRGGDRRGPARRERASCRQP